MELANYTNYLNTQNDPFSNNYYVTYKLEDVARSMQIVLSLKIFFYRYNFIKIYTFDAKKCWPQAWHIRSIIIMPFTYSISNIYETVFFGQGSNRSYYHAMRKKLERKLHKNYNAIANISDYFFINSFEILMNYRFR